MKALPTLFRPCPSRATWLVGFTMLSAVAADTVYAQRRPLGDRLRDRMANREGTQRGARPADRDTIRVGSDTRTYIVCAPRATERRPAPMPLVIAMHGGGGNAQNAEMMTRFTDLVERERIVVVYPDGAGRAMGGARGPAMFTWNAGHCCGYALKNDVDDVSFVSALIDTLSRRYPIDASRIYVTGMSNGAMMSHRVGRELSDRIAAIAPVVGAVFGDEPQARSPVSAIIINGLLDTSVPPEGGSRGGLGRNQWDANPLPNIDQGTYWARVNGCAATPAKSEQGQIITTRWSCPRGLDVELHQLRDGSHEWPGGPRGRRGVESTSKSMDATEVIWAFFKAHPKRS